MEDEIRMKDERAHVFGFEAVSTECSIVGEILFALDTAIHSYLLANQYFPCNSWHCSMHSIMAFNHSKYYMNQAGRPSCGGT